MFGVTAELGVVSVVDGIISTVAVVRVVDRVVVEAVLREAVLAITFVLSEVEGMVRSNSVEVVLEILVAEEEPVAVAVDGLLLVVCRVGATNARLGARLCCTLSIHADPAMAPRRTCVHPESGAVSKL